MKYIVSILLATLAVSPARADHMPATAAPGGTRAVVRVMSDRADVAVVIYPINSDLKFGLKADSINQRGKTVYLRGNAQLGVTSKDGDVSTVAGESISLTEEPISPEMHQAIIDLESMGRSDQKYRSVRKSEDPDLEADKNQGEIDVANTARLREIVARFGWPGLRFAGALGSQNAFLVLQHADTASQKSLVPLLRQAVRQHDARGDELAMLEDRLLIADGKRQLYGTQLKSLNPMTVYPISDGKNVDRRRKSVGLVPLKDYLGSMEKALKSSPDDK